MGRWMLKKKLKELEEEAMNKRQSLKAAELRIAENERIMALNKADIMLYNNCILHMIEGGSPCDYCEDSKECELEANGSKGCDQWMLHGQPVTVAKGGDADESTGIYGASS